MGTSWVGMTGVLPTAGPGATLVGAWLLTYAIHSTVLLLTAWWLASRPRFAASPAARHAIWNVALVAGWITSAAQLASPWRPVGGAWELPAAARRAMAAVQVTQRDDAPSYARIPGALLTEERHVRLRRAPDVAGSVITIDQLENAGRAGAPSLAAMRAAADTRLRLTVITLSNTSIAVAAWGLVALVLLARLALSRHRLLASLRARRDASRTIAGDALRHLTSRAGTTRPVRLSMSDALPAPAAISLDEIVVPTRALRELTIAEQEGVLAHELAHVVRGDPRWLRLATWIECIGWFQPLNRIARRELQLSAEFAADAWAVRLTREPLRLAQALARVAEWLAPRAPSPAWHMPGADGSPLVERVRRLTTPLPEEGPRSLRRAYGAMWIAAVSALAILPHVEAAPLVARTTHQIERIELRLADSSSAGVLARRPRTALKPGVRFLRLSQADVRFMEGAPFQKESIGGPIFDLRPAPGVKIDTGLVAGGARRMLIVTARSAS